MARATLGVIVTNRNFFADSLVISGRQSLLDALEKLDIEPIILEEGTTPLGAVESRFDAQECAQLFKRYQDNIEGVLVSLPNFGNEKGVADALRLADLKVPILVHAFPDTVQELTVAGRRDAFCGKISVTNNLYQYGLRFSLTEQHTLDPQSSEFEGEILKFIQVCKVVNGLRNARLGAIGARPNAFNTVRFSEKLYEAQGIDVSTADLSEIIGQAEKISDQDQVLATTVEQIESYAYAKAVPPTSLRKMAKLKIVIDRWMQENQINATAIQCWDSIQRNYGINACVLMSMMSDKLMPSACETDISGALSMYALTLASNLPAALVDWNNNYEMERNRCILFHCGNWAKSLIPDAEIISAEILGYTLGSENTWGAVQGRVQEGPMTFARIDTDERHGRIHSYVGEGRFTNDPLSKISGSHAVVEVTDLQGLLRHICAHGFAHHCAVTKAKVALIFYEAFNNYLDWEVHFHERSGLLNP